MQKVRIFIPLIGGLLVGLIISSSINYDALVKPWLAPPKSLFPIAWTILYLFIGYAYYKYREKNNKKETIRLYYVSLFLNYLWPIVFFNGQWFLGAVFIILLLLGFNYYLLKEYQGIAKYLMLIYWLWILYATYLNIGIYILN